MIIIIGKIRPDIFIGSDAQTLTLGTDILAVTREVLSQSQSYILLAVITLDMFLLIKNDDVFISGSQCVPTLLGAGY